MPGHAAPELTIAPASRVGPALISVARDAHRENGVALPPLTERPRPEARQMVERFAPDIPPGVAAALVAARAQVFGLISFELFGRFHGVVDDRAAFFAHAARRLGHDVGLLRRSASRVRRGPSRRGGRARAGVRPSVSIPAAGPEPRAGRPRTGRAAPAPVPPPSPP